MTTHTLTAADFVLARLAEDEAAARAASSHHWGVDWTGESDANWSSVNVRCESMHDVANLGGWNVEPPELDDEEDELTAEAEIQWSRDRHRLALADAAHIARHDPARVLAQCEALRAVVELHDRPHACTTLGRLAEIWYDEQWYDDGDCPTVRALASIWRDHNEWQEAWG